MSKPKLHLVETTRRVPLTLQLDQLAGFEGVKLLSRLLREYHLEHKVKISAIAARANLGSTTVSRIMSQDTKSPRMLTCIMLFKAMGFAAVRFE